MIALGKYVTLFSSTKPFPVMPTRPNSKRTNNIPSLIIASNHSLRGLRRIIICNNAMRRRVRYEEEDEEYGHNEEIAMLEMYSQTTRGEVLLVEALVDAQQVQVLIFKGFSSCLSYGTSPDPSKSVLPARAVIKSIDRVKGPFDPSNIQYLQKGLTWEQFKSELLQY